MLSKEKLEEIWSNRYIESELEETLGLVREIEKVSPLNSIVEIGVCYGGTLRIWEQLVPAGGLIIGVDKNPDVPRRMVGEILAPKRSFGGGLTNDWEIEKQVGCIYKFKSDRNVFLVLGDSTSAETAGIVEHLLQGKQIDFLFHDGIHYGPGPIYDYSNFERLLRSEGLFCIADVCDVNDRTNNLATQVLYHALPEPKVPATLPRLQGMALWRKQENFRIDPRKIVSESGLSYYGNGPCGGRTGDIDRFF